MPPRRPAVVIAFGLAAQAAFALPPCGAPTPGECRARFAAEPRAMESASCFERAARDPGQKESAVRALSELARRHPENPWLAYSLGNLLWQERRRSVAELARAADRFAAVGEPWGEFNARSNLALQLDLLDDREQARAERRRAEELAAGAADPRLRASLLMLEADGLIADGRDLARARDLLLAALAALGPDGPYRMRKNCLFHLGNLAFDLGRRAEARRRFEETADLARSQCDAYAEEAALASRVRLLREEISELPSAEGREETLAAARRTLALAERNGHREVAAKMHADLGLMTRGPAARAHFDRCLELAESPSDRSNCESTRARHLTGEAPAEAAAAVGRALALAEEAGDSFSQTYAWRERMRVAWRLGPKPRAVADSLAALAAIEGLRDREPPGEARAERFTTWVHQLNWLAGRFLRSHLESGEAADLERGFEVLERARARALAEMLAAVHAAPDPAGLPLPTLAAVRARLAADEALIAFQIAPWEDVVGDFAGGAWAVVVTREGARAVALSEPLAGRTALRPAVATFAGYVERGDGAEGAAAAALYRALLGEALRGLPAGVDRLVLVPDDALHRLAFAALRETPAGPPLVARYQLTVVPSAALWLVWRARAGRSGAPPAALVLADPSPAGSRDPLPHARREGRQVRRALGAGTELRLGEEATEGALAAVFRPGAPRRFGLVHLATHAVAGEVPEESFVALAPGGPGEDGRLSMREIAALDLTGTVVVLSACDGAAGEMVRGEGVMSLARAFFRAGATTVVATLEPLRDDHGAALFSRFARHLAAGRSAAAALRAAQLELEEEGAPAAAWAGVVVLGDGERRLPPRGRALPAGHGALALLGIAALLAAGWAAWRIGGRRRAGRGSPPAA